MGGSLATTGWTKPRETATAQTEGGRAAHGSYGHLFFSSKVEEQAQVGGDVVDDGGEKRGGGRIVGDMSGVYAIHIYWDDDGGRISRTLWIGGIRLDNQGLGTMRSRTTRTGSLGSGGRIGADAGCGMRDALGCVGRVGCLVGMRGWWYVEYVDTYAVGRGLPS